MLKDLQPLLQALSAQPRTEHPFLSLYVDWTPDSNGKRPVLQVVEQELTRISRQLAASPGPSVESFKADQQRIIQYLYAEAPKEAKSLAMFACNAEHVWVAQPLHVPMETAVHADRYPHLFQLARAVDDNETYAVVLADGQESRIFVVSLNEAELAGTTTASEEIKRFDQGGVAQMLFQRRTDNLVKAHAKGIADELGKVIQRHHVQHVIISTNDAIKGIVMDVLPETVTARLVDIITLDKSSNNLASILQAIEPLMRQVERQQEANDVMELETQVYNQGLGVVGIAATAMALSKGQVQTLLLLQSFDAQGRECPNCGTLCSAEHARCPFDETEMLPINLREAFTARAIQQHAAIQVVESSAYLDQHEGTGALLRYRDTGQIAIA